MYIQSGAYERALQSGAKERSTAHVVAVYGIVKSIGSFHDHTYKGYHWVMSYVGPPIPQKCLAVVCRQRTTKGISLLPYMVTALKALLPMLFQRSGMLLRHPSGGS